MNRIGGRGIKGWYYRLELSRKTRLWGLIFLIPWLTGFLVFFLKPLVETIYYSFNNVKIIEGGVSTEYVKWNNYIRAFTVDTMFNRLILTMISKTLPQVLIVIIFSLLAAILINGKYPGRSIARTIFFIPIIMGTSIASASLVGNDIISQEIMASTGMNTFGTRLILDVLANTGLPTEIVGYVSGAVSGIFQILAISGVPTLIFLAGLQSIPPSLYEVANIEGASAYEAFWKITLPMVSPMVLVCAVYSIIDAFFRHTIMVDGTNYGIVNYMYSIAFNQANYGLSAAMTVVYMLVSIIVVSVVSFLISKVVFYYD
ncbi:MAG TPA: sugar ABC transporter permease [Clostridiales bacterium]|nr:sugar ABC transporter permease [Clostridiales bacterium]